MPLFFGSSGQRRTGRERSEKTPQWGVCRPLCVSRCDNTASEPRRPLQKRGHNICCDLFFGFRQEIKMLGRSEFALRQGFAAQNACTAQKRRFFGFRQEIKMLGRSEFALRQGFAAQNACTAQKRRFFGFRQEIKMLGRSEFALHQGFAAQNACTAQKRCFLLR